MDLSAIKSRIDALLTLSCHDDYSAELSLLNELLQGGLTIMSVVYGSDSHQVTALRDIAKNEKIAPTFRIDAVRGILKNLKSELETNFLGSLQRRLQGEILTDLIQLARAILDEPGDEAKNVAAVLTAAAFEDTIRRMGKTFAGIMGGNELNEVINVLKDKQVLESPQLGIALSYLNFRNRALHANWEHIDRSSVHSVLAFVEQLLLKHFS